MPDTGTQSGSADTQQETGESASTAAQWRANRSVGGLARGLGRAIGTQPEVVPVRPGRPAAFNRAHRLQYLTLRRAVRRAAEWEA